jgi:NADH-quinone oxidoreductase subunit F
VDAVGHGERAAVGIDEFLSGEKHAFWRVEKALDTIFDPDAEPTVYPREKLPLIPNDRRVHNFDEVEQCWNESAAVRQAQRCLRCDYGKKTHTW